MLQYRTLVIIAYGMFGGDLETVPAVQFPVPGYQVAENKRNQF